MAIKPDEFDSFGDLLTFLRKRLQLTQEELGRLVGYSREQITRLEKNQRTPDQATIAALFFPALEIDHPSAFSMRLLDLAGQARRAKRGAGRREVTSVPAQRFNHSEADPLLHTWRRGVPNPLMPIIGRAQELVDIRTRLLRPETRLLTLLGPPGVGKTRLAVQAALELCPAFGDGACFVSLAELTDPGLVPAAIIQSLGGTKRTSQEDHLDLLRALERKHILLVLDNFEQILPAAQLVSDILINTPKVKILVTSRSPLQLYGEYQLPVPPLPLPELGDLPAIEELGQLPSIALFTTRAKAVNPEFALDSVNAVAVAQICVRLDGLPLAIELAAAQSNHFTPQMLLNGLIKKQPITGEGAQNMPARHHSLESAIAWSYYQLTAQEQKLFRWLGVFMGGFTSAPLLSFELGADVLKSLASLVDKSLIQAHFNRPGETRFTLLETIREFAVGQLVQHAELELMQRKHAEYFMELAEQAEPELSGSGQAQWIERLELEYSNLRSALQWAHEFGETETGLRTVAALWRFWIVHGHGNEGRTWCETLLADARTGQQGVTPGTLARVLYTAGVLAYDQCDFARAAFFQEQSLALQRELNDPLGIGRSLNALGLIANTQGNYGLAVSYFEESLQIRHQINDIQGTAHCLNNLGLVAMEQGENHRAIICFEQSIQIFRSTGPEQSLATTLTNLGLIYQRLGELSLAGEILQEGFAISRRLGNKRIVGYSLHCLALVSENQADWRKVKELSRESLLLLQNIGARELILDGLYLRARLKAVEGNLLLAVQLMGAVESLREAIKVPLVPADRPGYEVDVHGLRAQLAEQSFERAWRAGRRLSLNEAIAMAIT